MMMMMSSICQWLHCQAFAMCCQVWWLQNMSHIASDVVNQCLHIFQRVQGRQTVSNLSFWKTGRDSKFFCNYVGRYDGRSCSRIFSWRENYSRHQEHRWFWMDPVFCFFASPPRDSGLYCKECYKNIYSLVVQAKKPINDARCSCWCLSELYFDILIFKKTKDVTWDRQVQEKS